MNGFCNYCSSELKITFFLRNSDCDLDISVVCPSCGRNCSGTLEFKKKDDFYAKAKKNKEIYQGA